MTIRAADVVAPVFAPSEIIAFLFARMAGQAGLGDRLGRLILERDDFRGVAFFKMGLARSMTCFTTSYFSFPGADVGEAGVRSMREGFELIFMTVFARLAADVIRAGRRGPRAPGPGKTPDRCEGQDTKNQ